VWPQEFVEQVKKTKYGRGINEVLDSKETREKFRGSDLLF